MSGGKRIDDHKFWAGGKGKDTVFPMGVHTKDESSDGHSGELMSYEDTTEMIRSQQEKAGKKIKGLPRRPLDRN